MSLDEYIVMKEAVKTGPATMGLPFSAGIKFSNLVFVAGQGHLIKVEEWFEEISKSRLGSH